MVISPRERPPPVRGGLAFGPAVTQAPPANGSSTRVRQRRAEASAPPSARRVETSAPPRQYRAPSAGPSAGKVAEKEAPPRRAGPVLRNSASHGSRIQPVL